MDSFELNKIAGAILGTLLLVMALSIASEIIFDQHAPETPGFIVDVPEDGSAVEEVVEEVTPLPVLLASASVDDGIKVAKKCAACHSFDKGGANKVGPNLWNVVNQPKGHIDGFGYSSALTERHDAGETWSFDNLNGFLENPKAYLQGTAMAFAGLKKPEDRANMIAYLRSLSDSPVPLPDVAAAEEAPASEDATTE